MALTLVELLEKKGNVLKVRGIDAIDGTPVVDIKPYVQSDKKDKARYGWCEEIDFK
jgi:formylmethanofuran dehydrogenase subunit E